MTRSVAVAPRGPLAKALATAFVLCAVLVSSGCDGILPGEPPPGVIQPSIKPASDSNAPQTITREFAFENMKVKLGVPVAGSVWKGAQSAQKSAIFTGNSRPSDWVPGYYRAFIDEPHQEAFYTALQEATYSVRDREGLDASRYVELVAAMSQTLEYRVDPGSLAPKFPIETFADGAGDCDDKTLLAAGLLARDGYDVAVLLFEPEKHVALGIRAPGLDYKQTGYAYVELTEPSLVGIPAEKLAGDVPLTSQPVVIKVGSGERTYGASEQILYIERRLDDVRGAEERLKAEIASRQTSLEAEQSALKDQLRSLKTIRDPSAANAAIREYNARVKQYNARSAELNRTIARYNMLVELERYVAEHQTSRPQVYERLRAARL